MESGTTFSYLPHTERDRTKMLEFLGISEVSELFSDIPESIRMNHPLQLQKAMSELELQRHMQRLAGQNQDLGQVVSFLGAGSYEHYQPSVVDALISRSEFYTAYTPYQPEISQGMLQATFEYQTMIAELTGMDVANASMYDGPTALAEAGIVCSSQTRRDKLLVASSLHPEYQAVLQTYASGQAIECVQVPTKHGVLNLEALKQLCDPSVGGVIVQYPNFFGCVEDLQAIADIAHAAGALLVVSAYPVALGLLEAPGAVGADIVIAEGQSLGNSMAFGGPYLGMMAARKELMRRLPGRIVGQTTDSEGRRGFVLTLQAREQHIRREKATSNICSNQALNALAASIFLSYMGPEGMHQMALQNYHKAHYLAERLSALPGIELAFDTPFFNEFVLRFKRPVAELQAQLLEHGFLFGLALGKFYEELSDCVLLHVSEMRSREEMDALCSVLEAMA